jgi:uncharacterized cupin superfamily protein
MSFGDQQRTTGFVRSAAEGQAIELPGWSLRLTVTAADTAGRLTVLQGQLDPGHPGPAAHIHEGHDETFIMLAGRMRFRVGDDFVTASPGETIYASRLLAHGFANPFGETARYLAILTPSGYEEYFRQLESHVARTGDMPTRDEMVELMAGHHTVLAPALADPIGARNSR